jgi:hypothetical protein
MRRTKGIGRGSVRDVGVPKDYAAFEGGTIPFFTHSLRLRRPDRRQSFP